ARPGTVVTHIGNASSADAVAVQGDGKIVVGGVTTLGSGIEFALARDDADGTLDPSFNPSGTLPGTVVTSFAGIPSAVTSVVIQSDGKIVSSGIAQSAGVSVTARYNGDGSPDTSYGDDGKRVTSWFSVAVGSSFTSVIVLDSVAPSISASGQVQLA